MFQSVKLDRRAFVASSLVAGASLALAGTGLARADEKKPDAAASGETITVTDCAGRTVEVPVGIERVAEIHPFAAQVVIALAGVESLVDMDMVFQSVYVADGVTPYYTDEERAALSELPVTMPWMKGHDTEALLAMDPQVVFTLTGDQEADTLQEELGVPVICLSKSPSDQVLQSIQVAGEVLGQQEKAQAMADWVSGVADRLAAEVDEIPEEERPLIMYAGKSGDIMAVPGIDSVFGQVVVAAGGRLASADIEDPTSEATDVTMEQMLLWDPDTIVLQTSDERDEVMESEEWSALRAVINGEVYVPLQYCGFDGWFATLGSDWLNYVLYHEGDDDALKQLQEDMRSFYDVFYNGRGLTDEEIVAEAKTW